VGIGLDSRKAVTVARQPILDQANQIFGYQLLYRADQEGTAAEAGEQGARVLSDAVLGVGLDALTSGLRAFVSLSHHLLLDGAGSLLPPDKTVLELHNDIPVGDQVLETCKRMQADGYALALEAFRPNGPSEALLPYVQYVKVDIKTVPAGEMRMTAMRLRGRPVKLVAAGLETAQAAEMARAAGYHYFQGYHFCKPTTFARSPLPARRLAYMNLLTALNKPNLSLEEVENLVKHDVSLSYRVLRSVNSAAFGLQQEVTSIRRALVLLGVAQIRKWASVWTLAGLSDGGTPEAVSVALVRARCCELMGEKIQSPDASSYFLLGLCSLLDVILQRPMADALADMPLAAPIRDAILGKDNQARGVLDTIIAYEQGAWEDAERGAGTLGLDADTLPTIYAGALCWARELSRHSEAA
jgi:c-di-GMP-related signal transduction protein